MSPTQRADPPVRDRSGKGPLVTKPAYLPPPEILKAAHLVKEQNGLIEGTERIQAIARLLGFKRVGHAVRARIAEVLERPQVP